MYNKCGILGKTTDFQFPYYTEMFYCNITQFPGKSIMHFRKMLTKFDTWEREKPG